MQEQSDSPRLRSLLFRATGRREHLAAAKRLLDDALAKVPETYHGAIRQNLRVHREILAAWGEEIGDEDGRTSPSR